MSPAQQPPQGDVSVVMPVLNEAARIRTRLQELVALAGVREVIVVDGGSSDGTLEILRSFDEGERVPVRLLRAERGRARQMNAGARVAEGPLLLFLHADTQLPRDAARWVRRILGDPAVALGAFRTRTVDDASGRTRLWLRLADLRSRYSAVPYGDQALFMRKHDFEACGGYPDQPLMEDIELSLALRRLGKVRTAPQEVRVSGRRFLAHPLRDTVLVNVFPLLYRLGMSPERLAHWYADTR